MGRESAPATALTSELSLQASLATNGLAKVIDMPRRREKTVRYIDFDTDQTPSGLLARRREKIKTVERNSQNSHLFLFKNGITPGQFEVAYQHSAEIVSVLDLFKSDTGGSNGRPLAFFDTDGTFYDDVILRDLRINTRGADGSHQKHTAVFEQNRSSEHSRAEFTIPIDDIYCVSLARPPFLWQGDQA